MNKKREKTKTVEKIKELESIDNINTDNLESTNDFKIFNEEYNKCLKEIKRARIAKLIYCIIIILVVFTIIFTIWSNDNRIIDFDSTHAINDIKITNYVEESNEVTIVVNLIENDRYEDMSCSIGKDKNNLLWVISKDNTCEMTTSIDNVKNIYLKIHEIESTPYVINSLVIDASFVGGEKYYLSTNGSTIINSEYRHIGEEPNIEYKIENTDIAEVIDNKIKAKQNGITKIVMYLNNKPYAEKEIVVTSLIADIPEHFNSKKSYLSCRRYNQEEALLLDNILYSRIDDAGYKTRAGVVAAARFLTLEFPYRIDYFFENGRINESGVHYADGEGRYYHRGLYLNENKFDSIRYSFAGPAIWGCPLTNYENFGKYVEGRKMPNGLDCSGFVTWTLLNGGFDVGDYGAGETPEPNQMTDLGKRVSLTKEVVNSNVIKVGDLLNWWGHIAIIIGIDETTYYTAESLDTYEGLVIKEYKKSTLHDDWTFVMLMDSVYQEDGNITNMWY